MILIDSPFPIGHEALPAEVISYVVKKSTKGKEPVSEAAKQACDIVEAQFKRHANMLENYNPRTDADDVPCVMLNCTQTLDTQNLCRVSYPWLSEESFREQCLTDWEELIGRRIPVMDVGCDHFEIFDNKHVSSQDTSSFVFAFWVPG